VSVSHDRRPWLILSEREARALYDAVLMSDAPMHGDLLRALRMIRNQLEWIAGGATDEQPSIARALVRQRQR
jgi:hypothetical protein